MDAKEKMAAFNAVFDENDQIYRAAAKAFGLPECAFWILYALRESEGAMTQSRLCALLCQPKQTVNSSLKKLEADGVLTLCCAENGRGKPVSLTARGLALSARTVDKVHAAERAAISALSDAEWEAFFAAFDKYTSAMQAHMAELSARSEEERA